MDMLRLGKKGWVLIIMILIVSCGKEQRHKENSDNEMAQYLIELESEIYTRTKGEEDILSALNDSITNWKRNKLRGWYGDESKGEGKVDSLFAINKEKDKAIFVNLARDLTDGRLNALGYVYGVKIESKWYFFSGPTQFVSRKDLSKPTPFSELHQEALNKVFRGYLKKSPTDEWEINERFFSDLTSVAWYVTGWSEPQTQEDWDKIYLYHVNKKWKHKDTTAYSRTQ